MSTNDKAVKEVAIPVVNFAIFGEGYAESIKDYVAQETQGNAVLAKTRRAGALLLNEMHKYCEQVVEFEGIDGKVEKRINGWWNFQLTDTGPNADKVNQVSRFIVASLKAAGHSNPSQALRDLKNYAKEIANGGKKSEKRESLKSTNDFLEGHLVACYKKLVRTTGENPAAFDTFRDRLAKFLRDELKVAANKLRVE
jgi:hypothetical protein